MNNIETDDYKSHIQSFSDAFISNIFSNGIITEVESDTLKKWFANPDNFIKEIENLAEYYYISNGEIFQLFDITKVLPNLNYKIDAFDKNKQYEKHVTMINKVLHKVKHKNLTRDIISQTVASGTLCGIWLGDKNNPYFYIFDNLQKVFPDHMENGQWVVTIDMSYFTEMSERQRQIMFKNLDPYVTERDFKLYQSNMQKYQYKDLPTERTSVIRTHALKRNQNLGVSWVTQGLYDTLHKKKLRDLEKAVANKIIDAVAVLRIGSEKWEEYTNMKLPPAVKKKVYSGVKAALEKSTKTGITVVAIPEYADIEFPDIKGGDALDPKKFESINQDITSSYGISQALLNGSGGNFSSAKINIDFIYKKIGVLLEDIENEVYNKLINLILPTNQSDNFFMIYDKEPPLSNKEKIDVLMKLHSQEGFALKPIIDSIANVDFTEYIKQSMYEQEELDLPNKIKPYASAYTATGNEDVGRQQDSDPTNDNTIKSKDTNGNDLPN